MPTSQPQKHSALPSSSSSSSSFSRLLFHPNANSNLFPRQNVSSLSPSELSSLSAFLVDLCLQPEPKAEDQRSIAHYILVRWSIQLEAHPATYSFLIFKPARLLLNAPSKLKNSMEVGGSPKKKRKLLLAQQQQQKMKKDVQQKLEKKGSGTAKRKTISTRNSKLKCPISADKPKKSGSSNSNQQGPASPKQKQKTTAKMKKTTIKSPKGAKKAASVQQQRPATTPAILAPLGLARCCSMKKGSHSRPSTSCGDHQHHIIHQSLSEDALLVKSSKSCDHRFGIGMAKISGNSNNNNNEMLKRLLSAIEVIFEKQKWSEDELCTIVLCRLLGGYVQHCKPNESIRRLRDCARLDAVSFCLRAMRLVPRFSAALRAVVEDTMARTLIGVAAKDRKFLLKVRLSGMLPTFSARILDDPTLNNCCCAFLRLVAQCMRSPRNAQLFGRERQFAARFVAVLNIFTAVSTTTITMASSVGGEAAVDENNGKQQQNVTTTTVVVDDGGGSADELLMFDVDASATSKMARLVEIMFFVAKNKRNKAHLLDHQAIPVLKTILETHFALRSVDLVHQEIALFALAALRQFSKTKKGCDQLVALSTLEMCERLIAELSTIMPEGICDENCKNSGTETECNTISAAIFPNNRQLQDSLCALCLRCLPQMQFPYCFDAFPLRFSLPSTVTKKGGEEKSTKGSLRRLKVFRQRNVRQSQNLLLEDEDDAQSSDEDYGLTSCMADPMMADDSLMSCSGDRREDEDNDNGIDSSGGLIKEEEREEKGMDQTADPALGSPEGVAKYSRQKETELLLNYQKFFDEQNEIPSSTLHGNAEVHKNDIISYEQIARKWANRIKSVGQFVKVAFPDLVECPIDDGRPIKPTDNKGIILGSSKSMRQMVVQTLARSRNQSDFQRRIVYALDDQPAVKDDFVLDNDDVDRIGGPVGDHLHFESRFESGNLWKAIQISATEYELVLSPDINQRSPHFQWFYFEVSGGRAGTLYTFEIVNCVKSTSMFTKGMQPVLFSVTEAVRHNHPSWTRTGSAICYYRNLYSADEPSADGPVLEQNNKSSASITSTDSGIQTMENVAATSPVLKRRTRSVTRTAVTSFNATAPISVVSPLYHHQQQKAHRRTESNEPATATTPKGASPKKLEKKGTTTIKTTPVKSKPGKEKADGKNFFTLRFTIQFAHDADVCYIAYHFPYTYTRLQSTMERKISSNPAESSITDGVYASQQQLTNTLGGNLVPLLSITASNPNAISTRELVLITARVHPGESNSSWIMHGLINFLMSAHPVAVKAREFFIFKLVPMLNPDGVINGSHRCSLSGVDLNRVWNDPSPMLHPSIFHAKGLIQYMVDIISKRPFAFVDLHGHSRKANVFMYGNNPDESWRQLDRSNYGESDNNQQPNLLQEILDRISDSFALKDCAFSITKAKEFSARVATWRQFGLQRVYTMESTYWGFDQGPKADLQITIADLNYMGAELVEALTQLWEQTV